MVDLLGAHQVLDDVQEVWSWLVSGFGLLEVRTHRCCYRGHILKVAEYLLVLAEVLPQRTCQTLRTLSVLSTLPYCSPLD